MKLNRIFLVIFAFIFIVAGCNSGADISDAQQAKIEIAEENMNLFMDNFEDLMAIKNLGDWEWVRGYINEQKYPHWEFKKKELNTFLILEGTERGVYRFKTEYTGAKAYEFDPLDVYNYNMINNNINWVHLFHAQCAVLGDNVTDVTGPTRSDMEFEPCSGSNRTTKGPSGGFHSGCHVETVHRQLANLYHEYRHGGNAPESPVQDHDNGIISWSMENAHPSKRKEVN